MEIFAERLRVVMFLSLFTRARKGESLPLAWGGLNEKKQTIYIIQNLMGHASIVITEKYSHVLDDEKRKAINRMSGFLPGPEELEPDTPRQARKNGRKNSDCNKTATVRNLVKATLT